LSIRFGLEPLLGFGFGASMHVLRWRWGSVGPAVAAHAAANLLLGLWVLGRGRWYFW
jgi:hypothetical protein